MCNSQPECSHGSWEKYSSTAKCEDCGHTWTVKPPTGPEAHEHEWTEWGAVYHGGHLRWRDCTICKETESRTEGHICPECPGRETPPCSACQHPAHRPGDCEDCACKGPEAPACTHESWDERNPHPGPLGVLKISRWCNDCGEYLGRFEPTRPVDEVQEPLGPASLPRPPYLLSYATGSGAVVNLALPGETTTAVVNGALVISHPSGVLGIAQVKPIEMEN